MNEKTLKESLSDIKNASLEVEGIEEKKKEHEGPDLGAELAKAYKKTAQKEHEEMTYIDEEDSNRKYKIYLYKNNTWDIIITEKNKVFDKNEVIEIRQYEPEQNKARIVRFKDKPGITEHEFSFRNFEEFLELFEIGKTKKIL